MVSDQGARSLFRACSGRQTEQSTPSLLWPVKMKAWPSP